MSGAGTQGGGTGETGESASMLLDNRDSPAAVSLSLTTAGLSALVIQLW